MVYIRLIPELKIAHVEVVVLAVPFHVRIDAPVITKLKGKFGSDGGTFGPLRISYTSAEGDPTVFKIVNLPNTGTGFFTSALVQKAGGQSQRSLGGIAYSVFATEPVFPE